MICENLKVKGAGADLSTERGRHDSLFGFTTLTITEAEFKREDISPYILKPTLGRQLQIRLVHQRTGGRAGLTGMALVLLMVLLCSVWLQRL